MKFDINQDLIDQYYASQGNLPSLSTKIKSYAPKVTSKDYERGEITRYFAQQVNDRNGEIFEIAKSTYDSLRINSLYAVIEVRWKISGGLTDSKDKSGRIVQPSVITANNGSIALASETIPLINKKLTNPLQFWRGY